METEVPVVGDLKLVAAVEKLNYSYLPNRVLKLIVFAKNTTRHETF